MSVAKAFNHPIPLHSSLPHSAHAGTSFQWGPLQGPTAQTEAKGDVKQNIEGIEGKN